MENGSRSLAMCRGVVVWLEGVAENVCDEMSGNFPTTLDCHSIKRVLFSGEKFSNSGMIWKM